MLRRFLANRVAVVAAIAEVDVVGGRRLQNLSTNQWDLLAQICVVLQPFDDVSTFLCGSSYTTLPLVYPALRELERKMRALRTVILLQHASSSSSASASSSSVSQAVRAQPSTSAVAVGSRLASGAGPGGSPMAPSIASSSGSQSDSSTSSLAASNSSSRPISDSSNFTDLDEDAENDADDDDLDTLDKDAKEAEDACALRPLDVAACVNEMQQIALNLLNDRELGWPPANTDMRSLVVKAMLLDPRTKKYSDIPHAELELAKHELEKELDAMPIIDDVSIARASSSSSASQTAGSAVSSSAVSAVSAIDAAADQSASAVASSSSSFAATSSSLSSASAATVHVPPAPQLSGVILDTRRPLKRHAASLSSIVGFEQLEPPNKNPASEFSRYLAESSLSVSSDCLAWWREHERIYPRLSRLARKYLAIPATSVNSERHWSHMGNILSKRRLAMTDTRACRLSFMYENRELLPMCV